MENFREVMGRAEKKDEQKMSKSHKNEKTKKKVAETQDLLYKTISCKLIKSGQTVQKIQF